MNKFLLTILSFIGTVAVVGYAIVIVGALGSDIATLRAQLAEKVK